MDLDARMFGIEGKTLRQVPEEVHVRVDDSIKGPRDQGKHRVVYYPFGGVSGGAIEMKAGKRGISLKADPVLGVHVTGMRPDGW